MRDYIMVDNVAINIKSLPHIFVGRNEDEETNKEYPHGVYGSMTPPSKTRFKYWIRLRLFTAQRCATYWANTFILENPSAG